MKKIELRIIIGLLYLLTVTTSNVFAVVSGAWVEGNQRPDKNFVSGRNPDEILAKLIDNSMTDEQKVIKIWKYVMTHIYHSPGPLELLNRSYDDQAIDAIKFLHTYGTTICGQNSNLMTALWEKAGFTTRGQNMPAHVIPEVYYNGGWHMLDGDGCGYFRSSTGTITSLSYMVNLSLADRLTLYNNPVPDPHYTMYGYGWSWFWESYVGRDGWPQHLPLYCHSMDITLRPGETFTRYFDKQWSPNFQFWGNGNSLPVNVKVYNSAGESAYVKSPGPFPLTNTSSSRGFGMYANGEYVYTPDLSHFSCFEGVLASTDVVSQGSSPKLAGTSASSEVIFYMRTPYVICAYPVDGETADDLYYIDDGHPGLAGATRGAIISGSAVGTVSMSISYDMGRTWNSIGSLSGSFSNDITDYVKGRYQYWVKFNFTSGSGLDSLTLNTRVMLNSMMLYSLCGLEQGVNNIKYNTDNLSVKEIVPDIWTSQAIYNAGKYSDSNMTWENGDVRHLSPTDPTSGPSEVVYKVDCSGAIRKLDLGCRFMVQTYKSPLHEMFYSTDNGSTWVLISSNVSSVEFYSSKGCYNGSAALSGAQKQCLVKFKITPNPTCYWNNGFTNFFISAYYENPTTSDMIITHGWNESGTPYTHSETIHPGTTFYNYTINVGAALALGNESVSPGNTYIRMEVPVPGGMTSINGYVNSNSSVAVSGVTVALSGSSTGTYTTGSNGFYTFSVSTGGTYTITPTKTDWNFSPINKSYTNINSAQSNQDFFGAYTGSGYSISGTVTSSTGSAISGVTVTLTGTGTGSTSTNGSGVYQFSSLAPGNYTVTPTLTGVTFSPLNRSYTGLGDNQTAQNFTGTYIIPGGYAEFICSIKATGGDFSSLAGWENAIDSDLTSANNKVFGGAKTGTISDGASVTGATSGATGTVYHCTQTQMYLNVTAGTFQAGEQIRVDGSNYLTTSDAGNKVIAAAECYPMTDTAPLTIYGWTTNTSNYIEIRTPVGYKHSGKWDTNSYILNVGTTTDALYMEESNVRINGLQINVTKNNIDGGTGINIYGDGTTAEDVRISNCIIKGTGAFTTITKRAIFGAKSAPAGSKVRIWNNLIYDINGTGSDYIGIYIRDADRTCYLYNNTIINCSQGYYRDESTIIAKNNMAQDCTDGFAGSFDVSSDYNLSDVASDAPGSNAKNSATVTFADKTGKDFHITTADTGAKDFGTYLSTDTYIAFGTDIDGDTRSGSWDIGADEYSVAGDTIPPNAPTNLTNPAKTQTTLTLDWTASTQAGDGDYASYYRVYRNAVLISTASATSYTDTGLTAGTTYSYGIYAVDDTNIVSLSSATGSFSTAGSGADTVPPNAPTSLNSPSQTETSLTINWTASTQADDGDYASYYKILRDSVQISTTSNTTFTDTGLNANTTYNYSVYAVDDSSNVSTTAALGSFCTVPQGSDITPPMIVSITAVSSVAVSIEFSEPVDESTAETISNYSINNGITITNAVLGADLKTVILVTSQHSTGITYTITINSIQDLAGIPNTILPGSQMNYMYGDTTAPENVTGLGAKDNPTDRGGKIIVSWTKVEDADLAGYKVYYSPNPFNSITGATYFSGSPVSNPNTSSCVVSGLIVNSQDYYFGVLAIDLSGNVSSSIYSVGPVRANNNRLGETINGQKVYEVTMNTYNLKAKVIASPGLNDGVYINIMKPEEKASKVTQANTNAHSNTKIMSATINDLSDTSTEFNALLSLVEKVTIVLAYPSDITGETEEGLRIYCLNETTDEWELVAGSQELSLLANTVAVEVEHFSVYRIMGTVLAKENLREVRVYPNPFKPNDDKSENGTWDTGIIFDSLTNNSTIKIYTLSGDLVNILEETDNNGKYTWDVKNKEKEKLSSGIYIYRITDSTGDKITGKIGIVR
ncbi:MAG: hypothetical protein A2252_00025 [Elusimicrobia bacterium RIFOXYA2_FULL_39_19]|nr:MAG: hypothetical protein A2252_00025 [Elusimicrobia bacterium RIFOXYA2_FULL_39_19]